MKRITYILSLGLVILFVSCTKDEEASTSDPSNLSVEILSIDYETTEAVIQATANSAFRFELYIDDANEPAIENKSGLFSHIFGELRVYDLEVRAYGASGKYVKKAIKLAFIDETIALDSGYFSASTYDGYSMIWADEFNSTSINTNDWTFETGTGDWGWGNNELQYYKQENAWLEEGTLTIEARNEAYSGSNYTSARMITKGKKTFKYGRIDIRALLPEGQGLWPALWMLGNNISAVGWPACGEIDIMEMIGGSDRENTTHGTLHYENDGEHQHEGGSKILSSGTFAQKYHVFSIAWDKSYMKWYVDDIQFHVIDITPDYMTEFHEEFFFIFNVAVGGNWPGAPDSATKFPQQMKVDYIRVFQKI